MDSSLAYFAYGFAVACIIVAVFLPVFWNVAVRFAKRDISATSPINTNEVLAVQDLVRAKFAILIRQLEIRVQELQQQSSQYWFELEKARSRITRLVNGQELVEDNFDSHQDIGIERRAIESNHETAAVKQKDATSPPLVTELEITLKNSQTEVSNLKNSLADEKKRQGELNAKLMELAQTLKESEEIRDDLAMQVKEAENRMKSNGQSAAAEDTAKVNQFNRELTEAKSEIQSLNEKLAQAENELKAVQTESVELKSKLELAQLHANPNDGEVVHENQMGLERELAKARADRDELKVANAALEARMSALTDQDIDPNSLEHTRERLDMFAAHFAAIAIALEARDSKIAKLLEQDSPNHAGSTESLAAKIRTLVENSGDLQEPSQAVEAGEENKQLKKLIPKHLFQKR